MRLAFRQACRPLLSPKNKAARTRRTHATPAVSSSSTKEYDGVTRPSAHFRTVAQFSSQGGPKPPTTDGPDANNVYTVVRGFRPEDDSVATDDDIKNIMKSWEGRTFEGPWSHVLYTFIDVNCD